MVQKWTLDTESKIGANDSIIYKLRDGAVY